ncbi:MAG: HEPN domain-containing protein [Fibrobacter sp.]|nr:HEPN domain-containing protein [Fibrobacter sp.]
MSISDAINKINQVRIVKKIKQAVGFFVGQQKLFSQYDSIEDFVCKNKDSSKETAFMNSLDTIIDPVSKILVSEQCYISLNYIADFCYDYLTKNAGATPLHSSNNIYNNIASFLSKFYCGSPDFLIFPIRGWGYVNDDFLFFWKKQRVKFFYEKNLKCALFPQTNSFKKTETVINSYLKNFNISDINVEQYSFNDVYKWIAYNPILVIPILRKPSSVYDGYKYILFELKMTVYTLTLISALMKKKLSGNIISSTRINNFETWDYKHFLSLTNLSAKKSDLMSVPFNIRANELFALTELNFEYATKWSVVSRNAYADVIRCMDFLKKKRLQASLNLFEESFCEKIIQSLKFYHLSFSYQLKEEDAALNLAIAIESLCVDKYEKGNTDRLYRHIRKFLTHTTFVKTLKAREELKVLYAARCEVAHSAKLQKKVDIDVCRLAYIGIFLKIMRNWNHLDFKTEFTLKKFAESIPCR